MLVDRRSNEVPAVRRTSCIQAPCSRRLPASHLERCNDHSVALWCLSPAFLYFAWRGRPWVIALPTDTCKTRCVSFRLLCSRKHSPAEPLPCNWRSSYWTTPVLLFFIIFLVVWDFLEFPLDLRIQGFRDLGIFQDFPCNFYGLLRIHQLFLGFPRISKIFWGSVSGIQMFCAQLWGYGAEKAHTHLAHKQFLGHPGHRSSQPGTRRKKFMFLGFHTQHINFWTLANLPPPHPGGHRTKLFMVVCLFFSCPEKNCLDILIDFEATFPGGGGPKWHFSDFKLRFSSFGVPALCSRPGRLQFQMFCAQLWGSNFQNIRGFFCSISGSSVLGKL